MRDLENMLQGLGEKNKKAEQEGITMTSDLATLQTIINQRESLHRQ